MLQLSEKKLMETVAEKELTISNQMKQLHQSSETTREKILKLYEEINDKQSHINSLK